MATMNDSTEVATEMSEEFVWTKSIPNNTPLLIEVSTVFIIITTLFFIARTTVRSRIRQWGWDDAMATIAYLIMVVQSSFLFTAARHGFGKHRTDIPMMFPTAMFWFWMYQIFYKILGAFTKLTFLVLYLRLFPQEWFRNITKAVIAIVAAGSFAFMIGTIFQCTPTERNWDKSLPGTCIDFNAFWYSHAVFNTVFDAIVFAMPLFVIRTLHMNRRSRWGLASIFILGIFTIIASIMRMTELARSASSQTDPTWGSTSALIWTEIEANTAVICCCLPSLRQVAVNAWRKMLGKIGPETPTTRSQTGPNSAPKPDNMFGTVADARYSPDTSFDRPSEHGSTNPIWSPRPPNQPAAAPVASPDRFWRRFQWPSLRRGRPNTSIYEEDVRRAEQRDAERGIELGVIRTRHDFNVESEEASIAQLPPICRAPGEDVFSYSLEEFLQKIPEWRR